MNITWLDEALNDLQALHRYISADNPAAANRVIKRILDLSSLLSEQPAMGRPGRILNSRELIISGTPYYIPYRVKTNHIQILRVLHGAMQWPAT